MVVMVSLLEVTGCLLAEGVFGDTQNSFDRDALLLPDLLIEELPVNAPSVLKPAFDALWQSSGWNRSKSYNDKGEWIR